MSKQRMRAVFKREGNVSAPLARVPAEVREPRTESPEGAVRRKRSGEDQ